MIRHMTGLAIALACCGAAHAQNAPTLGKVQGKYVQVSRYLLVETSIYNGPADRPVVADIRFAAPLADGRKGTMARIEPDCTVEVDVGDVVEVALTESKGGRLATAPMPRPDGVVRVEAKADTDTARHFGEPPTRLADLLKKR